MAVETIGILMPGDMGHGCARIFRDHGFRVVTCLEGRSARTRNLAANAQIEDLASLNEVAREADLVMSILPPESALEQAQRFGAAMKAADARPVYADCNAIAPDTVRRIGAVIEAAGAKFIDAGIIGRNPVRENGGTRFYVSGPDVSAIEALDGRGIVVRGLGDEIGRASALKMIYASATKGTFSLHAATLTVAHVMGMTEPYLLELKESRPAMLDAMERMVPRIPLDAARWAGEMREIAATFEAAGVTRGFHDGAAAMMELAARTAIAEETRETVDESRTLSEALDQYVAALRGDDKPR